MCTCTGFQLFHIRKKYYAMQAATFFNLRRFFDHLDCICFDFCKIILLTPPPKKSHDPNVHTRNVIMFLLLMSN